MRTRLVLALAPALAACAATTPALTPGASSTEPVRASGPGGGQPESTTLGSDRWKERAPGAGCEASLRAFVEGRLAGWRGLPVCGRVDAEAVFGSSGNHPSRFEQFGEYRVYRRPAGSVLAWFLSDDIRVMELLYPKLAEPLSRLGAPEAKLPSRLSQEWEQWVYASRGIAAHVERASGKVAALFAFRPMSVAEYEGTDIASVQKGEAPVETMK